MFFSGFQWHLTPEIGQTLYIEEKQSADAFFSSGADSNLKLGLVQSETNDRGGEKLAM